jgi:HSP20 family protein
VAVELPGIGLGDLEITFQDGLLTIQGERHATHDPAAEKVHRAERRYGAFRRSITLPSHLTGPYPSPCSSSPRSPRDG